jgi:hypothetical protein
MNPVLHPFLHPQAIPAEPVFPRLLNRFEKSAMAVQETDLHVRFENHSADRGANDSSLSGEQVIRKFSQEERKPSESHTKYNQEVMFKQETNNSPRFRDPAITSKISDHELIPVLSTHNTKNSEKNPEKISDIKSKEEPFEKTSDTGLRNRKAKRSDLAGEFSLIHPSTKNTPHNYPENTSAQNQPSPTIKITIGRIELKATTLSQPAKQPPRLAQKPKLTLEDLLKSNHSSTS